MTDRPQNRNLRRGPGPGRPKGVPNKATLEIKELARSLTTENAAWIEATRTRLVNGKEHPSLVVALLYYAHGKPKDTVEHQGGLDSLASILSAAQNLANKQRELDAAAKPVEMGGAVPV